MNNLITVNKPLLNWNEKKYLMECIDTWRISSEWPFIKEFEEKFSNFVNRKYGIAVCNGSAALDMAVVALWIKEWDEVIMPTFTIISCASAIVRVWAIPVLIDADPITRNIDISLIEKRITKKTKAIMIVHIYWLPVDMDSILQIAKKYNLKIIEDAAEMHWQTYKWKPCWSFGDISIFSFYPNKHITTWEWWMVVTNDKEIADKCMSLRNLCHSTKRFVHEELGWNFRMTNMQAALWLAQLERILEFVKIKRNMGKKYTELLSDISWIQLPLEKTDYAENIYWVYGIVLKDSIWMDAEAIMKLFADNWIGTRSFFYPMHLQPVFKKMWLFKWERYPVAENMAKKWFYIPSGLTLTEEEIRTVAQVFKKIISK